MTYSAFDDGTSILNPNGEPIYRICPDVEKVFYYIFVPQDFFIASQDGSLNVSSSNLSNPQNIYATIKVRGSKDTLYRMNIVGTTFSLPEDIDLVFHDANTGAKR